MTNMETVIRHIAEGTTYSWDLTVLLGLGIVVTESLRTKLLQSKTTADEAAYVRSAYLKRLLTEWRR